MFHIHINAANILSREGKAKIKKKNVLLKEHTL